MSNVKTNAYEVILKHKDTGKVLFKRIDAHTMDQCTRQVLETYSDYYLDYVSPIKS